ncbi:MAG: DHH family phosphoesterase [ANME-2 cluster archaeon]|nr:DHH family phosphoesterase [ANME-2 cluster archaeon]
MHRLDKRAGLCADAISKAGDIHVVSHIDADGLTSAAIICTALERAGREYTVEFARQLDVSILERIADSNPGLTVFTDLGSGMIDRILALDIDAVISDHHIPAGDCPTHLNPHVFNINGAYEISGAGTTFLLARALGDNNDLAGLAVVGAVGDLQHVKQGELTGLNRQIMSVGQNSGVLQCQRDLAMFGKQTRPIYKMLQYSSDPYIPGLSGNEDACINFLKGVGLRFQGEGWLKWIDLTDEDKKHVVSGLIQYCIGAGIPAYKIERMVGEVYTLLLEREGTETRDASEYSTLLNATARYDRAKTGLAVCMGDREKEYENAIHLLAEHRRNLVEGINLVKSQGMVTLNNFQYFDAGSKIKDTIVGIVAGMSTSAVGNRNLPVIAFADTDDGVKVSGRGNYDLVRKGLNLGVSLNTAAQAVGGMGGGHDIAAGATIPEAAKSEFIKHLDQIIGCQLKKS